MKAAGLRVAVDELAGLGRDLDCLVELDPAAIVIPVRQYDQHLGNDLIFVPASADQVNVINGTWEQLDAFLGWVEANGDAYAKAMAPDMGGAMLPEMMRWLWRDYPVSVDPHDTVE